MEIKKADKTNYTGNSLLDFDRYQVVTDIYVLTDGELRLQHNPFTEDWSDKRKLEKAEEALSGEYIVYCAFEGERVLGQLMLVPETDHGRMIIDSYHVSANQRRKGIGRMLFEAAREEAFSHGAAALYASACPAKETIDFYMAMGFRPSSDPIKAYAEAEPFDIQLECRL